MIDNIEASVYERLQAGESIEAIANLFSTAMNKANTRYKEERKAEADKQIQINRLIDLLNNLRDYIYDYSPVDVSDLLDNEPITREMAEQCIEAFNTVITEVVEQMKNFTFTIKDTDVISAPISKSNNKDTSTPEERITNWLRRNNL